MENQKIGTWLRTLLSKNVDYDFYETEIDGKKIIVLIIRKAFGTPVTFKKNTYIPSGSNTKSLRDFPAMEAQLWDKLRLNDFEKMPAKSKSNTCCSVCR